MRTARMRMINYMAVGAIILAAVVSVLSRADHYKEDRERHQALRHLYPDNLIDGTPVRCYSEIGSPTPEQIINCRCRISDNEMAELAKNIDGGDGMEAGTK